MNTRAAGSLLLVVMAGCHSANHADAVGEAVAIAFRVGSRPVGRGTSLTLNAGNSVPVAIVPIDANNHPVTGLRPTIRSRSLAVATVDTYSRIIGRGTGMTHVVVWVPTPTRLLKDSFEVVVLMPDFEFSVPMPLVLPAPPRPSFKNAGFTLPRR